MQANIIGIGMLCPSNFEFASYSKWTSTSEWDEIQIGNEYDYVKVKILICSNFYIYYMERDIVVAVGIAC